MRAIDYEVDLTKDPKLCIVVGCERMGLDYSELCWQHYKPCIYPVEEK